MAGETLQIDISQLDLAAEAWRDDLVVIDNHAVYALAGNANNSNLQQRIVDVKQGGRGKEQPLGWTRPFDERVLSTIDVDKIEHRGMQKLLRNPDELTSIVGGLAFILAVADKAIKKSQNIPNSIMPEKQGTVQIYSPEGIATTTALVNAAIAMGVETVMTSANRTGEPESITADGARHFIESTEYGYRRPSLMVVCKSDDMKNKQPRGSYPIVSATAETFIITRPGCFAPEITASLFDGYPIVLSDSPKHPKHPENVLRLIDLPPDVRTLKGSEFRLGLLAYLGWSSNNSIS
jgi:tRNA A37 threonylcarbamoyladenosine synthetase subunit TsaC/SUA5/YrdC